MAAKISRCKKCNAPFIGGSGRPRLYCETCSPPKGRVIKVVTDTPRNAEPSDAEGELTVYGTTLAKLQEFGRVEDPLAQTALVLARALDGGRGGGVGLAAIAKEHREALAAATAGAKGEEDALDALGRRLA